VDWGGKESDLRTPEGIGIGSSVADLAQAFVDGLSPTVGPGLASANGTAIVPV
jgi:hypothetical protein